MDTVPASTPVRAHATATVRTPDSVAAVTADKAADPMRARGADDVDDENAEFRMHNADRTWRRFGLVSAF
jgi:hypothetical protein